MMAAINPGAVLQDSYDYTLPGDGECESLEPLPPSFSSHSSPFANENAPGSAAFRTAGNAPFGQSSIHPLSLHSAGNFDGRAAVFQQNGSDIPFQTGSSVSMSPLTSSRGSSSTSPSSATSSFTFIPSNQYALSPNVSYHHVGSQPGPTSSVYSPLSSYPQTYSQVNPFEARSRLTSIPQSSGMPPPSRSSNDPSPVSPPLSTLAFRSDYSNLGPLPRTGYSGHHGSNFPLATPHSPLHAMSRGFDVTRDPQNSSGYNFGNSMSGLETGNPTSASGQHSAPPFDPTKHFVQLRNRGSAPINSEIHAKIDKGFFKADHDWTCYRRNYFAVACSYQLRPDTGNNNDVEMDQVTLHRPGMQAQPIQCLSMCIAAKVDGEDGKAIELVQHTPKRDKGPMAAPDKKELRPNPSGNLGMFSAGGAAFGGPAGGAFGAGPGLGAAAEYEPVAYPGAPPAAESQNVANFERIQFKKATANNGKRRAAQQYFHIVVELFAKVPSSASGGGSGSKSGGGGGGGGGETEWVKVAHRISAQMVVRGRSPGHYRDEHGGRSTGMGPGGGGHHGGSDYSGHHGSLGGSLSGSHGSLSGGGFRIGGHSYPPTMHHQHVHQPGHVLSPDTHSTASGSSVASSLRSSLGPFADGVGSAAPDVSMEDAGPAHSTNPTYGYYPGTSYDGHAGTTAPRLASPMDVHHQRSGTGASSCNYLPIPPLREEAAYPRSHATIKQEPRQTLSLPGFSAYGSGAGSGSGSQSHWAGQGGTAPTPPKDCRSMLVDTKSLFPATQAL